MVVPSNSIPLWDKDIARPDVARQLRYRFLVVYGTAASGTKDRHGSWLCMSLVGFQRCMQVAVRDVTRVSSTRHGIY